MTNEANSYQNQQEYVDVKCYVELFGGEKTIYLAYIKKERLKGFTKSIEGEKIPVIGSNDKKRVYSAFECVREEHKFSITKANNLFSSLAM